jgi:hypothetical protein
VKIFLSSTYLDLIAHRRAAAEALERLGQQTGRMEVFGARPAEPQRACIEEIDVCELFVGIYAHRYGHVPDGSGVSITEAELDHAIYTGKRIFAFVVDDEHPWPPKMIEAGVSDALQSLRDKIRSIATPDRFTTPEDLAVRVATSVGRHLATVAATPSAVRYNEYVERLGRAGDLEGLLELALGELETITDTDYNQVFLTCTQAYSRNLVSVADAIPPHKQRYRQATFQGLIGKVVSAGKTLNAGRVRERQGYFQAVLETRSELIVPIGMGAVVLGALNSESEEEDYYSDDVRVHVERLADALARLLPEYGWSPGLPESETPWIKRLPSRQVGA